MALILSKGRKARVEGRGMSRSPGGGRGPPSKALGLEPEHLAAARGGVEPEEGQGEGGLEPGFAAADFAEEAAALGEMRGRFREDAADECETVRAAGERESGLVAVFRREGRHRLGVDIGRVREDEVVALAGDRSEEVAREETDARGEA